MRRVQKPAIRRSEARRLGARIAIQDEDLMPSERRFRDDSTKATRFHKPDDGDNRMNENDEDVVHALELTLSILSASPSERTSSLQITDATILSQSRAIRRMYGASGSRPAFEPSSGDRPGNSWPVWRGFRVSWNTVPAVTDV